MKLSRKSIIIGSTVILALIILIVIGKKRSAQNLEVNTSSIEKRTIIETVSANGKIRPEEEVKISADVSGEITELYVNEGDTVKSGQLLLKINPDLYLTALDRARANLSSSQSSYKTNQAMQTQAESRFREQEANYNRNLSLYEEGVISQAEFDAIKSAYEVAKSEVKAAEERVMAAKFGIENARAAMTEAQKNLDRTRIYAPTGGIVSALNSEKGERVVGTAQMAGTEIMVISNLDNIEVIVEVNENDILQINKNDTAIIEVDAYRDRTFKGLVSEISRSAKGVAGTQMTTDAVTNFEVKIRILKSSYSDLMEITDAPFLTGMSASVDIQTETVKDAQCLPIEAVTTRQREISDSVEKVSGMEDELDEIVFAFKDGKAVKCVVTTGIQDSRYIQILSGLEDVDKVITGPYDAISRKLEDGDEVTVTSRDVKVKLEES
ncbi:efflux RND transporter periplasmic adaptor subunit [bacterium]|nr:efflux RND transporter periplasmic adaptor subunit [bacterium]